MSEMKIALVHFRAGENDGVSLEMEKWEKVLERMGHDVRYLCGSLGDKNGFAVDSMRYDHPENMRLHKMAFGKLEVSDAEFKSELFGYSRLLKEEIEFFLKKWKPDLMVINNVWSLGHNLAAAIAFYEIAKRHGIRAVGHHHDFFWERERYSRPTCEFVEETLERYFPPSDGTFKHVAINGIAKGELEKRRGLEAEVVPNVFDFDREGWKEKPGLRKKLGLTGEDIVFLHATRIVPRKAIEMAVDFVAAFNSECLPELDGKTLYNGRRVTGNSRGILLLAGAPEFDGPDYLSMLKDRAVSKKVDMKVSFEEFGDSLWDAYGIADAVTYTSVMEGWGNQFIEAVFAKLPIILFEYPVFKSDIKKMGFRVFSLGDEYDTKGGMAEVPAGALGKAVTDFCGAVSDVERMNGWVSENFEKGKKNLSLEALSELLKRLIG